MIARIRQEVAEATSNEPLTVEEFKQLSLLEENETLTEEQVRLRLKLEETLSQTDKDLDQQEEPIPSKESFLRKHLGRVWVVAVTALLFGFFRRETAWYAFWAAMMALRLKLLHTIFCGEKTENWKHVLSAISIEAAYPLWRFAVSPELPFNVTFISLNLIGAGFLWAVVTLILFDADRPAVPAKALSGKRKRPASGNKKRKRS